MKRLKIGLMCIFVPAFLVGAQSAGQTLFLNPASVNDQLVTLGWKNMTDAGRLKPVGDYVIATASDQIRFEAQVQGQFMPAQAFTFRWDFEGDGIWDTPFLNQNYVDKTYYEAAQYLVKVEAIPLIQTENFKSISYELPVYIEENQAPFGNFDFTQTNNYVGEKVTYTAIAGDEQSGAFVETRFDSDADGVWDSEFRTQNSWWWIYDKPGEYNVRLQVRDPQGRVGEKTKRMTILPMPQPQTQVLVSHRRQIIDQPITLDGSQSSGRKLTYKWKVLGQPQILLAGPVVNVTLPFGDYEIELIIRDRLGVSDSVIFPISVLPNRVLDYQNLPTPQTPSDILSRLPGTTTTSNFVVPPGGVPASASPFQVEAGTAISNDGYTSNMRALQ